MRKRSSQPLVSSKHTRAFGHQSRAAYFLLGVKICRSWKAVGTLWLFYFLFISRYDPGLQVAKCCSEPISIWIKAVQALVSRNIWTALAGKAVNWKSQETLLFILFISFCVCYYSNCIRLKPETLRIESVHSQPYECNGYHWAFYLMKLLEKGTWYFCYRFFADAFKYELMKNHYGWHLSRRKRFK